MDEHLTPALCRAARGLLNWAPVCLASKAGMSEGVVRLFESGRRVPAPSRAASSIHPSLIWNTYLLSPQTEEAQDCDNDHNETDDINYTVHF